MLNCIGCLLIFEMQQAVTQDKLDVRGTYECPVYHTQQRGSTYIWNFHLKTRDKPSKWILAGAALLLQV